MRGLSHKVFAAVILPACLHTHLWAGISENQVLVVINTNSADSVAIGAAYTNLHPSAHVATIGVLDPVNISRTNFDVLIRNPLKGYLASNNLASTVIAIVTTKGVPYKIGAVGPNTFGAGLQNSACVDSDLTMLWQNLVAGGTDTGSVFTNLMQGLAQNYVRNPFHNTNANIASFSRANIQNAKSFLISTNLLGMFANSGAPIASRFTPGDMYLVTRISGYTVADATNALMRSQHIVMDINTATTVLDRDANNWDGNAAGRPFSAVPDFALTRDALTNKGFEVIFENTVAYVTNATKPVIAYAGYGNNAQIPMPGNYVQTLLQFTYAPGAMFNTYESFNASDFENPAHPQIGQGQIAEFILKGGTLGVGHVNEPLTFSVADNVILYARMLTGGVTWAEAAWASMPALSWQNIVIGDPLTTFTIVPTNAPPALAVRPATIDFDNVVVGATSSIAFTVQNVGNGVLSGTGAPESAGPFSVLGGSPFTLSVGQTTNVVVGFGPVTTGPVSNKIVFISNGGASTNLVTGTGVVPPLIISVPSTNIFLGATYNYDVNATGFPTPTYTLLTTPSGMNISTNTGLIAWTPTASQVGDNEVSVRASNGVNPDAIQNFTVTVLDNVSPALTILQPMDFQTFTNSQITVRGTADDNVGVASVTVNGAAAMLLGTNWTLQATLSLGTNLLTAIATDSSPSANQTTQTVRAILLPPPPAADFIASTTNGRAPLSVAFTDLSTGTITNRFWDFGDGAATNTMATSTLHTYEVAGSNTVTLIVSGPGGVSTNIKPQYITVVVYPPGDVNGDFHVTGSDSLLINQVLVGLRSNAHPVFAASGFANGDVNQTNAVNGADSLLINQVLVNLRAYVTTKILPGRHARTAPTEVTVYGVGFPTNSIPVITIGSPVNLTMSNIVVVSREQISALVPTGGGLGTGTVNVVFSSTNGVISFGTFINQ